MAPADHTEGAPAPAEDLQLGGPPERPGPDSEGEKSTGSHCLNPDLNVSDRSFCSTHEETEQLSPPCDPAGRAGLLERFGPDISLHKLAAIARVEKMLDRERHSG